MFIHGWFGFVAKITVFYNYFNERFKHDLKITNLCFPIFNTSQGIKSSLFILGTTTNF